MFPILFKIGGITLHTYGLMIALGMFLGLEYIIRRARNTGLPQNLAVDLFFYLIVSGLVGGRVFYVVTNWQMYSANPLDIFKVWQGGMVFFGGLIFAFIGGTLFVLIKKLEFWSTADLFAPALPLAHFFGRLGCFFAGCCYGRECHLPWAVTFKNSQSLAPLNVPLHPTQLYEAGANLLIFFILVLSGGKKHSPGKIFLLYVLLYSVMRFSLVFLRGDDRGAFFFALSPAQAVSAGFVAAACIFWVFRYSREGKTL